MWSYLWTIPKYRCLYFKGPLIYAEYSNSGLGISRAIPTHCNLPGDQNISCVFNLTSAMKYLKIIFVDHSCSELFLLVWSNCFKLYPWPFTTFSTLRKSWFKSIFSFWVDYSNGNDYIWTQTSYMKVEKPGLDRDYQQF